MTDTPVLNLRRGAEAAEKASAKISTFARTHYLSMKDQERVVLRLLTEAYDWASVDQYGFLPTKAKPADWTGDNWPARMGAVSRKDPALKGMFTTDYIADEMRDGKGKPFKANPKTWALGCLREEVIGDGTPEKGGPEYLGKIAGYRDKTREVTRKKADSDETETTTEKAIVIVNQAYSNFFTSLDGMFRAYGTILDRDYIVVRKGDDKNTDYQIAPLDPIGYDIRNPETAARYGLVVEERQVHDSEGNPVVGPNNEPIMYLSPQPGPDFPAVTIESAILSQCSDEYYEKFFDPRVTSSSSNGGGAPVDQQGKPDSDMDARLAEVAARAKGYGSQASDASAEEMQPAVSQPASSGARNFD